MPDRASLFENQQELKFSGEQGFFDKSRSICYLLLSLFGIALFAFLHFREVPVEMLELNSIAPRYIVSQVDFDFPDEEATIILRQDAVRNVGKIYRINTSDIRQKRIEFDGFLLYNQGWYEQGSAASFDELYRGTDLVEQRLQAMRFTDAHTLELMKSVGLPGNDYFVYSPNNVIEQIALPKTIWDSIQSNYLPPPHYNPMITSLIIEFFMKASWHFDEDIPAQRSLRKALQLMIPEKMTHVNAGSRIIDQGDKVTARHIAMLQSMKHGMGLKRNLSHPTTLIGSFLLAMLLLGLFFAYFNVNQPNVLASNRKLLVLFTVLVLTMALAKGTEFFLINSKNNLIETIRFPLLIPLSAILICSLINPGVATFASTFLAIISAIALAFEWDGFLLLNLTASLVAILSVHSLRRRKEIFVVCLKAWAAATVAVLSLHLYSNNFWQWSTLTDILSSGMFMLLTAILVVGLLPLLESAFKIMTDVTLMEYMDPNNDLLRRLTIEAPGTYQHSVVVGNLAEAAASAIGANGLFCRVATLYHDVGKMSTSQYFTENQMKDVNIHQLLTPLESAQVIMSHVSEGVLLAREAGLPEPIIDVIKEHHGTSLVYYFYRKQLEKCGGDKSQIDEKEFRYAGPKPRSKEAGIIMIGDSFEAASRSLDVISEETLTQLIDRLVREKSEDGQLDHCLLTFEELSIVKKMLVKTLLAAGHSRIKYPMRELKTYPEC